MILGFSTQLKNKPTYFIEKIQRALTDTDFFETPELVPYEFNFEFFRECKPKIHTIREDKTNRWKAGMKIDFFINVRKKDMFRFAPVLSVVSVQEIQILHSGDYIYVIIGDKEERMWCNHKSLDSDFYTTEVDCPMTYQLSQNDGFDTIEDFFAYFNKDFTGKIIHWTDKKY